MKHSIKIITFLTILLVGLLAVEHVSAYPTGWRLPLYDINNFSEGRAVISNGPGEGDHTGADAQAIDYFSSSENWFTNRNVHAAHSGTVRYANDAGCPGNVVGIEQDDGKASLYYHLSSFTVIVGEIVSEGDVIGYWGNSGQPPCVIGAHLHFTARQNVNWSNSISTITTGTPIVVSDLRGTGWYPWYPNDNYSSGFVMYSTTHPIDYVCSTNRGIWVRWPPVSWVTGGQNIDGYSWAWSTSATTTPDDIKDAEENRNAAARTVNNNNTHWYFHLKVLDTDGNWSQAAHLGPIWIASVCPMSSGPVK